MDTIFLSGNLSKLKILRAILTLQDTIFYDADFSHLAQMKFSINNKKIVFYIDLEKKIIKFNNKYYFDEKEDICSMVPNFFYRNFFSIDDAIEDQFFKRFY